MKLRFPIFLISLLLVFLFPFSSSSKPLDPFLGIAPQDVKYFKTHDVIRCRDGSANFIKDQLNDDFCDCPDGTDEPGTSACPRGKFYCQNAGHAPVYLFSSRINDGICDCCDGSDEYDGQAKCLNTCWEAGKVARDKLRKKIATYQEGVKLRKQEIEQAKLSMEKDGAELSKLKNEESILKGVVKQLKDHKDQIEKIEEKERLQKEKEEKEKKEAEEKASEKTIKVDEEDTKHEDEAETDSHSEDNTVASNHDKIEVQEDSLVQEDEAGEKLADTLDNSVEVTDAPGSEGSLLNQVEENAKEAEREPAVESEIDLTTGKTESSSEVINTGRDVSENTDGLSKEELGRLIASRWVKEDVVKEDVGARSAEADTALDNEYQEDIAHGTTNGESEGYASETDDENNKYDEDVNDDEFHDDENDDLSSSYKSDIETEPDLSDFSTTEDPSWLEKIQKSVWNIFQSVNIFQTPVNQSDAARIHKEYDESSTKLSKIQSRISSLTQKQKLDFGPAKEFYSFYGRCFESKQNKYTYKVCPYKQATQEEGHSTTRLGGWDKFEDSHKVMVFSSGDKCWNGPDRSLKVKLKCGLSNEITDVDEPSRCEYVALLATPALCQEEKLKELQQKLDLLNSEQPGSHDEL